MSVVKTKRARKAFITVIVVFALPVILAKLALDNQWFNYGVTNYGELFSPAKSLNDLSLTQQQVNEQWLLLYVADNSCQTLCEKTLTMLNSTYVLLGKEIPRVTPILLAQEQVFDTHRNQLAHRKWQHWSMTPQALATLSIGDVIIVDPLGNLVLKHHAPSVETELTTMGKQILADMKKLLKYSRVG